jgi:hypothetical protein
MADGSDRFRLLVWVRPRDLGGRGRQEDPWTQDITPYG